MKFDINDYKGEYVMHCKTEKEANDFCTYLDSIGKKWCSGDRYIDSNNYDHYQENTVYYFNENAYGIINNVDADYTILEWEDFMNSTFTKEDLKTGDVILRRNGQTEICNCELGTFICKDGWNNFSGMFDNLTHEEGEEYDIVAVRRPRYKGDCIFEAFDLKRGDLVYERKEVEEMTLAEVCKLLGKEIKIVG